MSKLEELKRQEADLEAQIQAVRKDERTEALKNAKGLCKEFCFTVWMLKGDLAQARKKW